MDAKMAFLCHIMHNNHLICTMSGSLSEQLATAIEKDDAAALRRLAETDSNVFREALHQPLKEAEYMYPLERALHRQRPQAWQLLAQQTDLLRLQEQMAARGYSLQQLLAMVDPALLRQLQDKRSQQPSAARGQWKRPLLVCDSDTCAAACCWAPCMLGRVTEQRCVVGCVVCA